MILSRILALLLDFMPKKGIKNCFFLLNIFTSMETLVILFALQIKHWYADFCIQTYMQTVKKGVWLHPTGISHSLEHVTASMFVLLLVSFFVTINPITIIWITISEGILHYIIDFVKVKYGCKDNTKPLFWNQFGLDQLAHQLTYLLMACILVGI